MDWRCKAQDLICVILPEAKGLLSSVIIDIVNDPPYVIMGLLHSGLQQSARSHIGVSVGDKTSRLLRRLECVARRIVASHCGLLPDTQSCGLCMRRECRERFPRHRSLEIPACISVRAWRTCRDACRDHQRTVSFDVGAGEKVPGACATRNFTYLVRGP